MESQSYNSVCTLADSLANNIVIQIINCASRCAKFLLVRIWRPIQLIDLGFVKRMIVHISSGFIQILNWFTLNNFVFFFDSSCLVICSLGRLCTSSLIYLKIVQFGSRADINLIRTDLVTSHSTRRGYNFIWKWTCYSFVVSTIVYCFVMLLTVVCHKVTKTIYIVLSLLWTS